jgi:hypothetical protein
VHIPGLLQYLSGASTKELLSGATGCHNGQPFVSGSGYTISTDLVKFALSNQLLLDHSLVDDLSLSTLLFKEGGITPSDYPRQNLAPRGEDIGDYQAAFAAFDPMGSFHTRCKTKDRRGECLLMSYIHHSYWSGIPV